ncbi:DUF4198 domain-containing protein [Campylobacter sp. RM9344]|uniref:DUF4198 domain-containing protein n=1 Tax=Campylobacter californiensis TaxID=1032243 RepID=A0AAW3ZS49_9BACT|nr:MULTISPECIES: DUF4198 domain-containing protein [unclassified Campylobacter]MBE2984096.1 DUF4198 domain-containing protein [Campylobacter sp. RM6883]MBE2986279.1 DUF4198 domain-containing protein [Campylobacter sp. RM12919]MBE2988414.1 DUF4198 domain-containing protein [Campylobacter sp. RM12920]MBE2995758.1 DUF4198 domain-containing protein [Campylobacter sp. RM6913]MBE3021936.1 DUF4198 domain-containing protein [Campylobacter sp. 7477a]MBE3029865.1 DUF4198 domain-containing protein [Camp
MKKILTSSVVAGLLASSAFAHFQMLYTPESALEKGTNLNLKLVFTHPFADEHTMDMGLQEDKSRANVVDFYVVHKEKKTDLKDKLKEIKFKGSHNEGIGYEAAYQARGMGDHVFALTPAPYFEANEGSYIQQITKAVVNVAGLPTNWDAELGLKAEIVPLTKPYSIWAGSTFTGIVKSEGKPVPFAEIEVEYLNHDIDVKKNMTNKTANVEAPQDSFVTLGIKADANGVFTFGIPKAGWWGFAALGVGPDNEYKGKELSQDAVIWVQAKDMK